MPQDAVAQVCLTVVGIEQLVIAPPLVNLATNSKATASFTSRFDHVEEINDGVVAFTRYSRNRWTSFGSPDSTDWIQLDFPRATLIDKVELFLWGDGGGVKAPRSYVIQGWNGRSWVDVHVQSAVPAVPQVSSVNTVRITPLITDKLRVVFRHDGQARSGVTEIRVWGGPESRR